MQKSRAKEAKKMKITTKFTIENKNRYSFVNVLIFLDNIVLGYEENFDLKGTVILDFSNIIENIDLLIHTENYLDLKNIIDLDEIDWDEYYCSTNDLLPRGSSLFDGDKLLAFKIKNDEFIAICKPYNQEIVVIRPFPISSYLREIKKLTNKLMNFN